MTISHSLAIASAALCAVAVGGYFSSPFGHAVTPVLTKEKDEESSKSFGIHWIYLDDDGEARSPSKAHDQGPRSVLLRTGFLVSALALMEIVLAMWNFSLSGLDVRYGLLTGGWLIVGADVVFILKEHLQPRIFNIGILVGVSVAILCSTLIVVQASVPNETTANEGSSRLRLIAFCAQMILGICLMVTSCSFRRRPDVYYQGNIVDGQYTSSLSERITFAWVWPILSQARRGKRVEHTDLPNLDHATQSRNLEDRFPIDRLRSKSNASGKPLWRIIVTENLGIFAKQWVVAIAESITIMIPPVCLYKILSLLEQREGSTSTVFESNSELWLWVLCMMCSKTLHVVLDQWVQWIGFAHLAIPIQSQLSAVLFSKSMRMKAITSFVASKTPMHEDGNVDMEKQDMENSDDILQSHPADDNEPFDKPRTTADQSESGLANLLSVDVHRVSDFCCWNVDLIRGLVQASVAGLILVNLIGWWSTLAGFAIPILLNPLARVATSHYMDCQVKVMSSRDQKTNIVTEGLHGIRQIRFSASEKQWEARILAARDKELRAQWQVYVWSIFLNFVWISMPALIGTTALSVYATLGGEMTPSVAFAALGVFGCLERTISALPATITELIDAMVSSARVEMYLDADEKSHSERTDDCIEFKNASVAWPSKHPSPGSCKVQSLNLRFPANELSVIHGQTGAGKSLLLAALIGEVDIVSGSVLLPRATGSNLRDATIGTEDNWLIPYAVAYVSQIPWIENATVREAVLFGLPHCESRYRQVLQACALEHDLENLPDGEFTEIGATGMNLSGGQCWRLTLARALYSRAGILVLDDIFSAVDSHVSKHLLHNALLGPLGKGRTRILATHHLELVQPYATYIVELKNGRALGVATQKTDSRNRENYELAMPIERASHIGNTNDHAVSGERPSKFVQEETRAHGRVKWAVYKSYFATSGGALQWISILFIFALGELAIVARSWCVALWTKPSTQEHSTLQDVASTQRSVSFYLSLYLIMSFLSIGLVALKITTVFRTALRASRHMFENITTKVLRAPLRWLDTEPTGRILNRFVNDFVTMDTELGGSMMGCINGLFSILTIVVSALLLSFWMIVPVVILAAISLHIMSLYMDAARDTKRLESIAKSPILELVNSVGTGITTIRSFGRVDDFRASMFEYLDRSAQASWYVLLARKWMSLRQGLVGSLFASIIAAGVAYFGSIDASLAGFDLSLALGLSDAIQTTIGNFTATELSMSATERILEYANLKTETIEGAEPSAMWPASGSIVVRDLEVDYDDCLESVLKCISFSVEAHERIGIVGRTGSGKSSLTLALFRLLEARRGSIEIDGVDVSTLNLYQYRSRLSVIPQDSVLFSGSLRYNLDPSDEYTDRDLLDALQRVDPSSFGLNSDSNGFFRSSGSFLNDLSTLITRGGSNLSQGEKQLVCLARAVVEQPKILVLDEATSAVDMATDAAIQRSIRNEFSSSTLLVVAHRLSSILDFDRALVMNNGRVVEYDRPETLAKKKGHFWEMLNDRGEKAALQHFL